MNPRQRSLAKQSSKKVEKECPSKAETRQDKKKEIWLSPMQNAHTQTEKSKKHRDNIKTPPKSSITQRLRTDLGRQ